MKIFFLIVFSLPLFAFEGKKLYQCTSMYRLAGGNPQELSKEEQDKSRFSLVFNKQLTRLQTSDGMIYTAVKSRNKGRLYMKRAKVNGRTIDYKLKVANENGLYKSVSVTGYGNLVNEYTLCQKKETK